LKLQVQSAVSGDKEMMQQPENLQAADDDGCGMADGLHMGMLLRQGNQ
jgi:hypothetical protein